jgi:cytochrome c oxidase subunit 2
VIKRHRELFRFIAIWAVLAAIATPLALAFLATDQPPGVDSDDAKGQVVDNDVLTAFAVPFFLLFVTFLVYALVRFRQRGPGVDDGPRIFGNRTLQNFWIAKSCLLVIALFVYGTVRILEPAAAGSGQGPTPLTPLKAAAGSSTLPVQVIGQQWQFTYRYPTYGGLETPHLVLPVNRTIALHVTSLDVTHSFWAYQLGVKADANPGVDNVAYVKASRTGEFDVRCAELCGIWHGYMFDHGRIVGASQFNAWTDEQRRVFGPVLRYLPRYRKTYLPAPARRGG